MRKGICIATLLAVCLCGCGSRLPEYNPPEFPTVSTIEAVGSACCGLSYDGEEAKTEEVLERRASEDGCVVIEKKASYYEVYLDFTRADHRTVGRTYAEMFLELGMEPVLEPFLHENIVHAFPNLNGDYTPVEKRLEKLLVNMPADYREEIEGFAEGVSEGRKGIAPDGKMSYEEGLLAHLVGECLRPTNCNASAVWGEKSASGERMLSRTMEWQLGSSNQMCTAHAITHFINGEGKNSYTGFSVLGMLDILTGINDKEVFAGPLDAGTGALYECEGKKCYTFELRYALETMSDARSIGEYMVAESKNFTFSHNIFICDRDHTFVAEDSAYEGEEYSEQSILRDADTPLMDGLTWDNPDCLCAVNSFVTEGSEDRITYSASNYVRFYKYNKWFSEKDKLSFGDLKGIVTNEKPQYDSLAQKIYGDITFEVIVYDYATGELQVALTGEEGILEHPDYIRIVSPWKRE
ncbi:MAG: hypothetical protein K6E50_13135 [Lachnospiraceae bacterium]|nr:hypothetical protein [Lachnospiraceae bacterium]